MTLQTWGMFILVSILPVLSPGPAILLAISNSIRFGPRATLYSALANSLGLTILGIAVCFGLSALMSTSTLAFAAVKICGAVYLGYLGAKLWVSGASFDFNPAAGKRPPAPRQLFSEALLLALTNPKGFVLLAALLPPFLDHESRIFPQALILATTFAVMAFCNHLFLAWAGSRARRFLDCGKRMLILRRALAFVFISFGAALAVSIRQ